MKSIAIPAVLLFALLVGGIIWLVWPTELELALKHAEKGNYNEAVHSLEGLADQGNPDAMVALAGLVQQGLGGNANGERSGSLLESAANLGHGGAALQLGDRFREGRVVAPDRAKAVEWYAHAAISGETRGVARMRDMADAGFAPARYRLGMLFRNGKGVPQSLLEASSLFRAAAESGYGEALKQLQQLAEGNIPEAPFHLGRMYAEGRGITPDREMAKRWMARAAEMGHAEAQFQLAVWYESGWIDAPVPDAAMRWYRAAAAQGVVEAQFRLARMLRRSGDHESDNSEAIKWFIRALHGGHVQASEFVLAYAREGRPKAQYEAGHMYRKGSGVSRDSAEAAVWWRMAAEQGHIQAQFDLGFAYAEGIGVQPDGNEAARWYALAASQGFSPAWPLLKRLAEGGVAAAQYHYGIYLLEGGLPPGNEEGRDLLSRGVQWVQSLFYSPVNEGVTLLQNAAEQGMPEAQFRMGEAYRVGKVLDTDPDLAQEWYRRAAEQGHTAAREALEQSTSRR